MYLFSRIGHFKKIILKGRGFRCGSDEKMMRMWFGLEIDVVGLPPLPQQEPTIKIILKLQQGCHQFSSLNKPRHLCTVLKRESTQTLPLQNECSGAICCYSCRAFFRRSGARNYQCIRGDFQCEVNTKFRLV